MDYLKLVKAMGMALLLLALVLLIIFLLILGLNAFGMAGISFVILGAFFALYTYQFYTEMK